MHPEHVLPELVVVAEDLLADDALQRPRAVHVVEVLDARAPVGQELVAELAVHSPVGQGDEARAVQQVCNDEACVECGVNELEIRAPSLRIIPSADLYCLNDCGEKSCQLLWINITP